MGFAPHASNRQFFTLNKREQSGLVNSSMLSQSFDSCESLYRLARMLLEGSQMEGRVCKVIKGLPGPLIDLQAVIPIVKDQVSLLVHPR